MPGRKNPKSEFKLTKKCQTLLGDVCMAQAKAEKEYRYTICADLRHMCTDLIHAIRKANDDLPAGSEARIKLQMYAIDKLKDIKDILPIVGKLIKMGVKLEAQLELSVDNIRLPLQHWMETDQRIAVKERRMAMHAKAGALFDAMEDNKLIREALVSSPEDPMLRDALDESEALLRIREQEYRDAIHSYDKAVRAHLSTQEAIGKQAGPLADALKKLRADAPEWTPEEREEKKQKALQEITKQIVEMETPRLSTRVSNELMPMAHT